jgi:DHA1 family bicyclomycin/chloramphenicol resistance-like MFS transporter
MLPVLGLFMMAAPVSTDMVLPALMRLTRELDTTPGRSQLTLSYFFLGFAIGQLVWGALSDRFGRRRPLATGILLYIAGTVGCALSGGIQQMMFFRFVQAFGGCAMPVLAQAMARDYFGREGAARALSIMMLVMALAPALSPLVGARILAMAGWQAIFWTLAGYGIAAFALLRWMPETRPTEARQAARHRHIAHGYGMLLRDPVYLRYALTGAAISGAAFTYITGTPFVYIGYFGIDPGSYGLLFALNIVGMSGFTLLNSRVVLKQGHDRMLAIGVTACAAITLIFVVEQLRFGHGIVPVIVLLFCFMSMRGLVGANAVAGAMADHPERAGAASALTGCLQFGAGYVAGLALDGLHDGTPRPMAMVMAACCITALLVWWTLPRRHA